MGEVITLPKKEVQTITKRSSLVGMDYNPKTEKECATLYRDAPQIAAIAQAAVRDGLQGKALLTAKKIICGDEWDAPRLPENTNLKWQDFLSIIKCQKSNASYLLEFAGYKEAGGEIETASHYREVKKVVGKDQKAIDDAYQEAGGEELKTAKEIREKLPEAIKIINVENIFEAEVGTFEDHTLSTMELQDALVECIPEITSEEWKSFYYKVSEVVHPDKGGTDIDMTIVSSFNKMMKILFKQQEEVEKRRGYNADYEQWKKDKGYKSDLVKEDEL